MSLAEPVALAQVHWGAVGTLLLSSLVVMGSPGPATVSLTAAGSAWGVRRCAGYLAGIIIGTILVLVAVATGITAVLLAVPWLRAVLIAVSAAYMLRLAYHIAKAPPGTAAATSGKRPSLVGGILLGIGNPKGWLAISAVFASVRLSATPASDAAVKTVALSLMIVLIATVWLIVGSSLASVLRNPRQSRIMNITLAVALAAATAVTVVHLLAP